MGNLRENFTDEEWIEILENLELEKKLGKPDDPLIHLYIEDKTKAEEGHFTNDFTEPMVQLDPYKTMICLAHDCNTVEKTSFIPSGLLTKHKINKFFKDNDTKMINRVNELVEKLSNAKNI
jgi:hypothetical protein